MKFENQRPGIGTGAVVAAVIVVILIAGAAYFIYGTGSSSSTTTSTTSSENMTTTTSSSPSTTTTSTTTSSTTTSTTSTTTTSSQTTTTTSSSTTTTSSTATMTPAVVNMPQGAGSGTNFSPSKVTVVVGVNNTINFVDQDSIAPHNVYFTTIPGGAANPNPSGGPPTMLKGDTYSVTLTTPGTYDFECQFHSTWMSGVITVVSG